MNNLSNVTEFIKLWDEKITAPLADITQFKKSSLDNINYHGNLTSDAAVTLTKNDPNFYTIIEDGVRPLVKLFIDYFDWVSFSSCAGHKGFTGSMYKKRMVQLLPRNTSEEVIIIQNLNVLVEKANDLLLSYNNPIKLQILQEPLTSDGLQFNSIKLLFTADSISEEHYFQHVGAATEILCSLITQSYEERYIE